MNRLIDGRDGVSLKTGIELYKTLVRPCSEFSVASWATMPESGVSLLEKVQARCLRKILGAKCHASGDAVDVIAGVTPVRLRIQQLCSLEFVRILQTSKTSKLRRLAEESLQYRQGFTPLRFLHYKARLIYSDIQEVHPVQEALLLPTDVLDFQLQYMDNRDSVDEFVQQSRHQSVLIFAHGAATCEGIGSAAAVLLPCTGI